MIVRCGFCQDFTLLYYNDASIVYVTPSFYQVLSSMKVYGILFPIL